MSVDLTASRVLVRLLLAIGLAVAFTLTAMPHAEAMTAPQRDRVLHVAAAKKGTPYRYGADGPRAFDCSGYTRWVFAKIGRGLPRSSAAQSRATRRVKASDRRRGDLVYFRHGGRVYHVGIYAGRGTLWHSPRTGQTVQRARLWTRSVSYGRVR